MCEDVKRGLATVGTLSRRTHTTKGQRWDGGVVEAVIEGGAAGACLVENCTSLVEESRWV
jgi:hypothetical protein